MKNKKIVILFSAILLLTALGSSAIVSNSNDWRDHALLMAYSDFQGENFHAVTGYSEAVIVSGMLSPERSHTVYESDDPVWDGYQGKLKNEGVTKVSTETMNWEQDQYDLYSNVEDQVKGFVVIKPGYGIDTISVFPKVIRSDYWPLYFQSEETVAFLKGKDKPVVFYGEYLEQPWKKLEGNQKVIAEGSKEKNNLEMVHRLIREFRTNSSVVSSDSYIEKGFVTKGDPIMVGQDVETASNVIETYDLNFIEVIGAANVGFGTNLENSVDSNVTVIAKFGRKFTGVQGLGSTYPLKKIPVTPVRRDISLRKVNFDSGTGVVELVFQNKGTIPTVLNVSAISLESGDNARLVSSDVSVLLRPEKNTTVDISSNLSFQPDTARISFNYRGSSGLDDDPRSVNSVEDSSVSDLSLEGFYYMKPREEIVMELKNTGDKDLWVSSQLKGLKIMNRTVSALSEEERLIESGSTKKLRVNAYLTESQIESNSNLDVAATYGVSRNFSRDYERFSDVGLEVREASLLTTVATYGVPVVLLLAVILIAAYIWRRKKLEQELRGLR